MIYPQSFITLLKSDSIHDKLYFELLAKELENKEFSESLYLTSSEVLYNNIDPLECVSGQYLDVKVNINDMLMLMSDNELHRFNGENSIYCNSDDYSNNPPFANFEYWAKYNKINMSEAFTEKLKDKGEITSQMILFDVEHKCCELPYFITDYDKTLPPMFEVKDLPGKGLYTHFVGDTKVLVREFNGIRTVICLCNIPYEYYSTHILQPCSLHYNLTLGKFVSSMKESPKIEALVKDIAINGLQEPLTLKINSNGVITKLLNCNTRYIAARYLKLPFVPCILIYNGTKDITNYLDNYPLNNEFCKEYLRINMYELYKALQ